LGKASAKPAKQGTDIQNSFQAAFAV
jgi:hypothetical protein